MSFCPETMGLVVIPLDIITEILSRLPVKFLLRFRCVSKPWCSLIDSKEFVKRHLNRSVITNTNLNLILGIPWTKFSISLDSIHPIGVISYAYIDCLTPPPPVLGSVVLNSCNGLSLVLLKNYEPAQLYIWNSFTRKYRRLPPTPIEVGYDYILNSLVVKEFYAFAYVSETDDYKVVRVIEFRIDSVWLFSEAKIFSLTSNKWERIEDFPYRLICSKRIWGSAHLNGIVHTIVENDSSALSIMAFDVRSKKHDIVSNPNLVCENVGMTIGVLGGCLCLIYEHSIDFIVDVWVMKDYGVKDSWFKLLSIAPNKFSYPFALQPLAYSKDGEEVLLHNENDQLIYWYNLRTGTVRQIPVNMTNSFYIEVCFESLVSLPGFISVDNVKGKRQCDLKKDNKEKIYNKIAGALL